MFVFGAHSIIGVAQAAPRDGALCPLCREPFTKKQLQPPPKPPAAPAESKEAEAAAASSSAAASGDAPAVPVEIVFSSKIDALMTQLSLLRREHPNAKALVFSQFTDTIKTVVQRSGGHHTP